MFRKLVQRQAIFCGSLEHCKKPSSYARALPAGEHKVRPIRISLRISSVKHSA